MERCRDAKISILHRCEQALERFHELSILEGDANRYSFCVSDNGGGVKLSDLGGISERYWNKIERALFTIRYGSFSKKHSLLNMVCRQCFGKTVGLVLADRRHNELVVRRFYDDPCCKLFELH